MMKKEDQPYKTQGVIENMTTDEIVEFLKCADDPIYFIEKYVKVQHPTRGAIPLELYDFQKPAIHNFVNYRNNILLFGRQLGKTTLAAAYILWFVTFNQDKTVLMTSHTLGGAIEILDRIKFSYKELPYFLKESIEINNRSSILLRNKSRIVCRASNPDSTRGLSVSLLYCDEIAFLRDQAAFLTAISPTLATGGAFIVTSTPASNEDEFAKLWYGANNTIKPDGTESDVGINGFKATFATWRDHPDRDEEWARHEREKLSDTKFRIEHECEFIDDSSNTLIDSRILQHMRSVDPVLTTGQVKWFKVPSPGNSYFVVLDPSLGTSNDWSAIQILEMPSLEQVGEWSSNTAPPRTQVKMLYDILNFIMDEIDPDGDPEDVPIYWSFENNTIGEAILQIIEDSGVEHFPGTLVSEKRTGNMSKRFRRGLNTTPKNKIIACSKFKSLIESNRLVPKSVGVIKQLKNFASKGVSFSARIGNDDLVMAFILAVRLIEMTKNWEIYDPEIISDSLDTSYNHEPLPFIT